MLAFHQAWFYVATLSTGLVGVWGVGLSLARRTAPPAYAWATAGAIGAMLVQVATGLWMYGQGREPGGLHLFYGVVIVFTLAIAYVYRSQLARRPALSYGLLLLFVMGLGLRAWVG